MLKQPTDLHSFERFLARAKKEGRIYKLSLKKLAQDCQEAERAAGRLPRHLRHVRGFTWFFGYVIDREKNDVYLLGYRDPSKPPINIDCLVTALRAAYFNQMPQCSLDPHPNPRYQKSVVYGVPWNTRWAKVMIDADYDMKKISQGRLKPRLPGLTSWFDLRLKRLKRQGHLGKQQNRWWFNRPRHEVPRTLQLDEQGDLVLLQKNPVVIMTEMAVGGRYGTGLIAREAEQFARGFNRNMERLGRKYRNIGELLTLYRLLDLAVHLKTIGKVYPPELLYWLRDYKYAYAGPPAALPTLTRTVKNVRTAGNKRYTFWVQGGVRMPLDLDPKAVRTEAAPASLKDRLLREP